MTTVLTAVAILSATVAGLLVDRHVVRPVGDAFVLLCSAIPVSLWVEGLARNWTRPAIVSRWSLNAPWLPGALQNVRKFALLAGWPILAGARSGENLSTGAAICFVVVLGFGLMAALLNPSTSVSRQTAGDPSTAEVGLYVGFLLAAVAFFASAAWAHSWYTGLAALACAITVLAGVVFARNAWHGEGRRA